MKKTNADDYVACARCGYKVKGQLSPNVPCIVCGANTYDGTPLPIIRLQGRGRMPVLMIGLLIGLLSVSALLLYAIVSLQTPAIQVSQNVATPTSAVLTPLHAAQTVVAENALGTQTAAILQNQQTETSVAATQTIVGQATTTVQALQNETATSVAISTATQQASDYATATVQTAQYDATATVQQAHAADINLILNIPSDYKPIYKVAKIEDVSFSNVKREVIRITLPMGLDRLTVELNLKQAVKDAYQQRKQDAITVFAYKSGESAEGVYTVGTCTFAPYGDWARAQEKPSLDKYEAIVDLNPTYFQPPPQLYRPGTQVTLQNKDGDQVGISSSSEDFSDDKIIVSVPNGTRAIILGSQVFPLPSPYPPLISYKVSVTYNGHGYTGWVDGFDVTQ